MQKQQQQRGSSIEEACTTKAALQERMLLVILYSTHCFKHAALSCNNKGIETLVHYCVRFTQATSDAYACMQVCVVYCWCQTKSLP
jgi:hypothetical protein